MDIKIDDVFGRWTVLVATKDKGTVFCRCECGTEKPVHVSILCSGKSKSCGCLRTELHKQRTGSLTIRFVREYRAFRNAINRCEREKDINWKSYGGRGIRMCEKWRSSFRAFIEDMGECPLGFELDRIDNDKNYEPENCRWIDLKTNRRNTQRTRLIEYDGQRRCIREWEEVLGIVHGVLWARLKRGMPVGRAMTLRAKKKPKNHPRPNFERVLRDAGWDGE